MQRSNDNQLYKHTSVSPKDAACRLFKRDTTSLYLLSLLLTADVDSAEACFISSLDDCIRMKPSVREWTNDWTRRVVVQNAILMLRPAIEDDEQPVTCDLALNPALHAVMRLKNFERFVFVLSMLEGYSNHECAVLLGPPTRKIAAAKLRALAHLAGNARRFVRGTPSALRAVRFKNSLRPVTLWFPLRKTNVK